MIIDLTVDAAAVERRAELEMDMLGRMSALEACFDSRMRQLRRYLDSRLKGKQSTPESSQAPSLARSNSSSDNIRLPGKNTPVQVGAADRHDTRMRENIEGIFAQVERQKRELQHAIQSVERLAQCTNHLTKAVIQLMDHSGLRGDLRTTLDSEVIPAVATAIFHCTVIQGVGPAPKKRADHQKLPFKPRLYCKQQQWISCDILPQLVEYITFIECFRVSGYHISLEPK